VALLLWRTGEWKTWNRTGCVMSLSRLEHWLSRTAPKRERPVSSDATNHNNCQEIGLDSPHSAEERTENLFIRICEADWILTDGNARLCIKV